MTAIALCEFHDYMYAKLIISYETKHGFYWYNETFNKDNFVKACNYCFENEHCSATEYYRKEFCEKIDVNVCYNEFINFDHTFPLTPYMDGDDDIDNGCYGKQLFKISEGLTALAIH